MGSPQKARQEVFDEIAVTVLNSRGMVSNYFIASSLLISCVSVCVYVINSFFFSTIRVTLLYFQSSAVVSLSVLPQCILYTVQFYVLDLVILAWLFLSLQNKCLSPLFLSLRSLLLVSLLGPGALVLMKVKTAKRFSTR